MGYLLDHCHLDKLSSEIINQCQPYKCSKNADIDSFFHDGHKDNYADYLLEMMGYSHCFYTDEDSPRMVCAFSLSSSALRIEAAPNKKRKEFNKKIPFAKRRSQYPAILIGQLCVFDGFGHHDFPHSIGEEMIDLIKTMVIDEANNCAARYLIVDAINDPNVIDFYLRNGFEFLFESDKEELECLRHKEYEGMDSPVCKTRLMLFDLILLKQ